MKRKSPRSEKTQAVAGAAQPMSNYQRVPLQKIIAKYGIKGLHPDADLFPMLSDEEFQAMCADVAQNGFLYPIKITDSGLLVDGRNRLQVAWAIGKDPDIERCNPPNVWAYIISINVVRRHLTIGQRAMIGRQKANIPVGANQYKMAVENLTPISQEQAAADLGIDRTDIAKANTIIEYARIEAAKVAAGRTSLDAAYKAALQNKRSKSATHSEKETGERNDADDSEDKEDLSAAQIERIITEEVELAALDYAARTEGEPNPPCFTRHWIDLYRTVEFVAGLDFEPAQLPAIIESFKELSTQEEIEHLVSSFTLVTQRLGQVLARFQS
jgi:hypothetical protein